MHLRITWLAEFHGVLIRNTYMESLNGHVCEIGMRHTYTEYRDGILIKDTYTD